MSWGLWNKNPHQCSLSFISSKPLRNTFAESHAEEHLLSCRQEQRQPQKDTETWVRPPVEHNPTPTPTPTPAATPGSGPLLSGGPGQDSICSDVMLNFPWGEVSFTLGGQALRTVTPSAAGPNSVHGEEATGRWGVELDGCPESWVPAGSQALVECFLDHTAHHCLRTAQHDTGQERC